MRSKASELRKDMTVAEKALWSALRSGKVEGLQFRRQHAVGRFILDFYCPSCKLVVEVDGSIHQNQIEHDAERTRFLNEFGYSVIRFSNQTVLNNLPDVLIEIKQAASNPQ